MGPIAIVGAGGFVGARLVESLVLDGNRNITAVVRAYRSFAGLARFGSRVTLRVADAEQSASLVPAFRDCYAVVNLTTGSPASIHRTTEAIFKACVASKVSRLVHLSSAVVYGDVLTPQIDDDTPPSSGLWMPYARAKAAAEVWLKHQLVNAPLQVAILRPGIIWGVRSPHTMAIIKALLDKRAYLVDGGRGIFNSIFIDNLLAGIQVCLQDESDVTGFYNVGDRELITWRDFYAGLANALAYDIGNIPNVSGRRFPWSAHGIADCARSLPVVNELYELVKARLPDGAKARLKAFLGGRYNYDGAASEYVTSPLVERELWSLQRVNYKLPTTKFARRFKFMPPITFKEGILKTLDWLEFIGYIPGKCVSRN